MFIAVPEQSGTCDFGSLFQKSGSPQIITNSVPGGLILLMAIAEEV